MKWPKKRIACVIVACLIIGLALVWVYARFTHSSPPATIVRQEPLITHSTSQPDESKSKADAYDWRGLPDEPKKITISKLGVEAFIQKMGVDQNQQIAVPSNVHLAGWFANSVQPGRGGLSIIVGHVSGKTTGGVFKELSHLKAGDEFEIEIGSGTIRHYRVLETQQLEESKAASRLFSQNPTVKSQLNLITCGGDFNSKTNQYEDRVIVSSELI